MKCASPLSIEYSHKVLLKFGQQLLSNSLETKVTYYKESIYMMYDMRISKYCMFLQSFIKIRKVVVEK